MGGVDLYDQHCNDVNIKIRSKKWTFLFFLRLLETSLSNSTVLYNICRTEEKKSTYEFATEVANYYLRAEQVVEEHHKIDAPLRRVCNLCSKRIFTYCFECKKHFCSDCFELFHQNHKSEVKPHKRGCNNDNCDMRTQKYCLQCKIYMCKTYFDGPYHKKMKLQ